MKSKKILKLLVFFIIAILVYCINPTQIKAASTSPVITVEKYSYSEKTNELEIKISLKEGFSMKKFDFALDYDTTRLKYIEGTVDSAGILVDSYDFEGGVITLSSEELASSEITTNDILCVIKFKILSDETILEEDIPNDLFTAENAIIKNDEEEIDTSELIEIKNMAKKVNSISMKNIKFEKDTYLEGEEVKIISGQAVINYSNYVQSSAQNRTVDLITLLDTNGNSIDIRREGVWLAECADPYVYVSYREKIGKAGIEIDKYELNNNKLTIPYGHDITVSDLEGYKIVSTTYKGFEDTKLEMTTEDVVTPDMITFDKYGDVNVAQNVYVKYTDEIQLPLTITLKNYVDYIYLTKNNITIDYGSKLNAGTLTDTYKVVAKMANGDIGAAGYVRDYINKSDINTEKVGTYSTTINFQGKTTKFTVAVVDKIVEIKLEDEEKEKIQKEYMYGEEELKLNGAQLTITKLSGDTKVDLTTDMIKNYNSEKIGAQKLTIEYEGYTAREKIEVTVNDYIVDIILVKPAKTSYLPEEKLDLTGATVQTLSASGKIGEAVPVTIEMISGYNSKEMGAQRLTVTYEGFQKTFDVILGVQTGTR